MRHAQPRHSRAGGNPDLDLSGIFKNCSNSKSLDSRLRGNDSVERPYLNLPQSGFSPVRILRSSDGISYRHTH
ncbi:hypothetical protein DB273_01120 [Neisseria gonorrhoeae]|nr:hypothetical protein EGO84_02875 [Neisseria gonorrhoeae]ROU26726.1 hypothetical protein EGP18_02010 [Neisseria gonorrhoeae]ROU68513.1 hypothetical protein EGO76_02740 [Neisseria gonorrhoeae]ROV38916.1 hypothetical protein EGP32_02980 [Neisseria gonorrhoeae]TJW90363.1 hypothetical protein E8M66_06325 [Neisseria gonorrhoeae]